jgi:RNA polymerase sigma factor (sigma-70 family)
MKGTARSVRLNISDCAPHRAEQTLPAAEPDRHGDILFLTAYPLARRAAQVRARAAVRGGALARYEAEDLEQELLIACWRAISRYNPERASLRTFLEHVAASRRASVLRSRPVRKRHSLGAVERSVAHSGTAALDLRADVARVIASLGAEDQQFARLLMLHSPSEVSRMLRVGRSTVYKRIAKLQIEFTNAGLRPLRCAIDRSPAVQKAAARLSQRTTASDRCAQ